MILSQKDVNLHSHTFYSGHASGTAEELVDAAKDKGLKVLGISEHGPKPGFNFDCPPGVKYHWMNFRDLESYTYDVKKVQKEAENITVLLGCECEWDPERLNFYKEELLGRLEYNYLIMGIHFVYDDTGMHYCGTYTGMNRHLVKYVKDYTDGLRSGLFLFGAHPDLFAPGFPIWNEDAKAASKDIIQCAIDCNIPLELNGYAFRKPNMESGRRYYSVDEFWETARDMGAKICTNSDAHRPCDIFCSHPFDYAEEKGIKYIDWKLEGNKITPCL